MGHIHSDTECDFTVSATIIHNNKVLVLLHHRLHKWLFPGGHIELNELPIDALYREIYEETGLRQAHLTLVSPFTDNLHIERDKAQSVTQPMPFDIDVHVVTKGGHRHIDFGYILTTTSNATTPELNGAQQLAWLSLSELEQQTDMPQSIYGRAKYALEKTKELTQ